MVENRDENSREGGADPILNVDRVRHSTPITPFARALEYIPQVDSTNRILRARLASGSGHATTIIAEHQSAGKGRMARQWQSPEGSSVLLSTALEWPEEVQLSVGTMLAGLAVAEAVTDTTGLETEIKWPNDVLVGGRKVCGILCESVLRAGTRFVILGIGINVNFDPALVAGIPSEATSLRVALGRPVDREDVILALLRRLVLWYGVLTAKPEDVFSSWVSRQTLLGSAVLVDTGAEIWEGEVTGFGKDGALYLRTQEGSARSVYAANVSVRRQKDPTTH